MKYKKLITLLLFVIAILPFRLSAQETGKANAYKKNILIGVNFSAGESYRVTTKKFITPNYAIPEIWKPYFFEEDKPSVGYSAGANFLYDFSKHISVETGLQYSRKTYTSKVTTSLIFGDMIDPRYGFVYEPQKNSTIPSDNKYDFDYLSIPLKIIYKKGERKLSFRAGFGLAADILLNATAHAFYNGKREEKRKIKGLNTVGLSAFISSGINYKLNDRFSLSAEPTFNFSLTETGKNTMQILPWNAIMNFSFYYQL